MGSMNAASSSICDDNDAQLIEGVRLGDLIWVKLSAKKRWPAQVVDEERVRRSSKPGEKVEGGIPVRLYGSNEYLYADPMKRRSEFKMKGGGFEEIFEKALNRVSSHAKSRGSKEQESKFPGIRNKTSERDQSKPKNKNAKEESSKTIKQGEVQGKRIPRNVKQDELQKKRKLNRLLQRSERRMRVMQSLALIAPVGSPFSSLS